MKRILLLLCISVLSFVATAQNYENMKNLLALQQYATAKKDFDNAAIKAVFTSKPEAYLLKANIYAGLGSDDNNKNTPVGDQLIMDGDLAFKKYREMDPSMALLSDLIYQNGPINLYSGLYAAGYKYYTTKNWQAGFEKLKKAVGYSDLLINKKLLTVTLDTNVLVLAGVTAENSGNKDDAAVYYGRLADHKVAGDGFESVYRYMVNYSFGKKNMANFEKYKALGKSFYPKSEYFNYDKVDFAVGLAPNFVAKIKALEEMLAKEPANFKANQVLGETLYDTLNPVNEAAAAPANAAEWEKKMVTAFSKAAAAKPGYANPYIYLGDHFINKAVKIQAKNATDKKYGEELLKAQAPYEKAVSIYRTKSSLDLADKQQYKKAVIYLADIASFKKVQAKGNPANVTKYTAEEKKWNDLWETIK